MGDYDSSKTRVAPVFDRLLELDPTGSSWLDRLLRLPEGFDEAPRPAVGKPGRLIRHAWYPDEHLIRPPLALLRWLVSRPTQDWPPEFRREAATGSPQRDRLVGQDELARQEALALLEAGAPDRAWYVLEGPTHVDAYLEAENLTVVVEGKRTEPAPTIRTKWMSTRHQMLRNLDAVWDGGKPAYGFFAVEARDGSDDVPPEWQDFVRQTVSSEALEGSLPHRSGEEQASIKQAFLGATTWQRISSEFGLPRPE
jgi:hypothetical protein